MGEARPCSTQGLGGTQKSVAPAPGTRDHCTQPRCWGEAGPVMQLPSQPQTYCIPVGDSAGRLPLGRLLLLGPAGGGRGQRWKEEGEHTPSGLFFQFWEQRPASRLHLGSGVAGDSPPPLQRWRPLCSRPNACRARLTAGAPSTGV